MRTIIFIAFMSFAFLAASQEAKEQEKNKRQKNKEVPQVERFLSLEGTILEKDLPLPNAIVLVKINNRLLKDTDTTNEFGDFKVKLNFDFNYTIEFAKEGYVSKLIEVSTLKMPEEDKNFDYETAGFKVELFKKVPDLDLSEYLKPVGRIAYNSKLRQFTYDRKFIKERQKELVPLEAQVAAAVENMENQQRAEDFQYDLLIRDADLEFQARDYFSAMMYYQEALEVKPHAEYPKSRIEAIKQKNKELALAEEERYLSYLSIADSAYKMDDWELARINYVEALSTFPTKAYPKEQLEIVSRKIDEETSKLIQQSQTSEEKVYTLKDVFVSRENEKMALDLARKYPQGLTEEIEKVGNRTVHKRIIVDGNRGIEYKKITYDWGGVYYFKNGASSSQFIWTKEAIQ